MKVVVTSGAIRRAKLQSSPTNQHPVFTGWMTFLSLPNSVRALKGGVIPLLLGLLLLLLM